MSTTNPVSNPTTAPGGWSGWIRHRSRWALPIVAGAAFVVAATLLTRQAGSALPPGTESDPALLHPTMVDASTDISALPATGAGKAAGAAHFIDHSVVESKSLVDEPDMTGASIGLYGP
jgi:hypothetical protein